MMQAVAAFTGGREIVPTGIFPKMSRRSLLGAATALPLAAIPVAAAAAEHPTVKRMAESRAAADAKFWALHAEFQRLEAAWEADPDDSDDNWNGQADKVRAAFDAMMLAGVFSVDAVLAKMRAANFELSIALPGPVKTLAQMIEWDLNRCAMQALAIS